MVLSAPENLPAQGPTPLRQAGLDATRLEGRELVLEEVAHPAVLRLHTLEEISALRGRLAEVGIDLPLDTNAAAGRDPSALCLRPGEWLLTDHRRAGDELIARASPVVDPGLTALLDVSDGLGMFELTGAAAPWLLAKLCCPDVLAGVSAGKQHCARTRMGDVSVVLHFRPDPGGEPEFDLVFDRSVAKYLWDLLSDAAPHAGELYNLHGAAA
jgi:heterotetrameric sarcosine oxidase gamma subunit